MALWFVAKNLRKSMSSLGLVTVMSSKDVGQGCMHQTPKYNGTATRSSRQVLSMVWKMQPNVVEAHCLTPGTTWLSVVFFFVIRFIMMSRVR